MKEPKKKNKVIILFGLPVIVIAVILGFIISNTTSVRLRHQLNLAEKYLDKQDYEQAVAEFDKAAAIDSMNERAYTGKIEAYTGMEDYEQAAAAYAAALRTVPGAGGVWTAAEQFYLDYEQFYIDAGDYESADAVLEEGYDLLGSEKIYYKIGEPAEIAKQIEEEERRASGIVRFPFGIRDITVRGYDLLGDHFAEMRELYPTGEGYEVANTNDTVIQENAVDGSYYINNTTYENENSGSVQELWVNGEWCYRIYYSSGSTQGYQAELMLNNHYGDQELEYEGLGVPIKPGASYEDWCDVMQIAWVKELGIQPEQEDNMIVIPEDGEYPRLSMGGSEGTEYWVFMTDEYKGIYRERSSEYGISCDLTFQPPLTYSGEIRTYHSISATIGVDGIISAVNYNFRCVN